MINEIIITFIVFIAGFIFAGVTYEIIKLVCIFKKGVLLNNLRERYKDLVAIGKENTKEAKILLKRVTKLESSLKNWVLRQTK